MWKATIRGLVARKVRLALTALAILLGVSFVSATYVLTDTVKRSFDAVFAQTLTNVDLQVQGASALGDVSNPGRIPDATIDDVRAVPGVQRAEGFLKTTLATFVDAKGDDIGGGGPPTIGVSWIDGGPFRLTAGRAPAGPRQVAMDAGTAAKHGFAVGDDVRVLLSGAAKRFRIVGLFGFGDTTDFGAVTFAAFDLATAQREFDAGSAIDARLRAARPGRAHRGAATAHRDRARTRLRRPDRASRPRSRSGKPVRQFLGFFTDALLGFAAIGVVVGAFIIFNTFTILVTQRTRELGLLRAMGATGGQVVWSVVLEAFVVGGGGVGRSGCGGHRPRCRASSSCCATSGSTSPTPRRCCSARTVVVSLLVGIVVTVVAARPPGDARGPGAAGRGDRRRGAPGSAVAFRRRVIAGLVVLAAGGRGARSYGLARARDVDRARRPGAGGRDRCVRRARSAW